MNLLNMHGQSRTISPIRQMCDLWTLDNWKGHKQPYLCLMPKAMCICEFAKMPTQANKVGHITFPTADKGCLICSSHKFKVVLEAFLNQQIQNFLIAFTIVTCDIIMCTYVME